MKRLYAARTTNEADALRRLLAQDGIDSIAHIADLESPEVSESATSGTVSIEVSDGDFDSASVVLATFLHNACVADSHAHLPNNACEPIQDIVTRDLVHRKSSIRLWCELVLALVLQQPFFSLARLILKHTIFPYLPKTFAGDWAYAVLHDCLATGISLCIIWYTRESWRVFGLRKPRWSIDTISGCLTLFFDRMMGYMASEIFIGILADFHFPYSRVSPATISQWHGRPEGAIGLVAILVLSVAIAFKEEIFSRGIILTRVEQLTGSRLWAVVLSAAQFSAFHWYGGARQMSATFAAGAVYGVAFVMTRSLWPVVFAHAFVDVGAFLYEFSHHLGDQ